MRIGVTRRRGGRAILALLVGLLVGGWLGGGLVWMMNRKKAQKPLMADPALSRAEELNLVPTDAIGFAHARLADMWKTDAMAEFRGVLEKAGPAALAALDENFVPAPSSLDRVTVVALRGGPAGGGGFKPPSLPAAPKPGEPPRPPAPANLDSLPDMAVAVILAFSAPYDSAKLRDSILPAGQKKTAGGKDFWHDPAQDLALHSVDDRTLILGTGGSVTAMLARPPAPNGALAPALKLATEGTRHFVAGISGLGIPPGFFSIIPADARPVAHADSFTLAMVMGEQVRVEVRANYPDEPAAEAAETAARTGAEKAREQLAAKKKELEASINGKPGQFKPRPVKELPEAVGALFALGALNTLDDLLAKPPLKRDGAELRAEVTMPSLGGAYMGMTAMSLGMLLPAVSNVRDAAARTAASNNLHQMAIGMHAYNDAYSRLPAAALFDPKLGGNPPPTAKPLLSWRVAILPYIEGDALYKEFKLDEPWDSEHNKKLIPKMPKIYASPRAVNAPGETVYKVFVAQPQPRGPVPPFDLRSSRPIQRIEDGASNTILIVEGGAPVIWTKPEDIVYDPEKPLPNLGLPGIDVINVALADGSVRAINLKTLSEKTLRNAITANDGMVVGPDW